MIYKFKRRLPRWLRSPLLFILGLALLLAGWLLQPIALAQMPPASATGPALQSHPLPPTLAQWQDPGNQGDYFSAIAPTDAGYLVWSQFPVKVYVQSIDEAATPLNQYERNRAQAWVSAVIQAVHDWTVYLPLEIVASPDEANIQVLRSVPPLQRLPAGAAGNPANLPRVRSAETRYELFVDRASNPPLRSHRFTVRLSPIQTPAYTLATARHELGHALGIWGHSPTETDVMYFAQVRNPPVISVRDINTLKRIYEQPTQLGWNVEQGG
ncbi:peptidase [Phormidium tenue FACHB-886]|nr:peptidase [Phormidium tenue FACHB-886]